ncbi:unnamed protein product [Pseudo-nitzschia multistriata]|uniref:Protein kinase domain-containing protein n=1 Tax=Pseudo-nitzschia multistriata TaxID=183589 RepID=A0A448ZPM3_9STRA|nr:unnamed protein product [Pseudo-nitzschia multistriata]
MSTLASNRQHHSYSTSNRTIIDSVHWSKSKQHKTGCSLSKSSKQQQQQQQQQQHNNYHDTHYSNESSSSHEPTEDPTAPLSTTDSPESSATGPADESSFVSMSSSLSALTTQTFVSGFTGFTTTIRAKPSQATANTGRISGIGNDNDNRYSNNALQQQQQPPTAPPQNSFLGATFGPASSSGAPPASCTAGERQQRSERILRFASKRLKKSHVEDYYEYKCRKRNPHRSHGSSKHNNYNHNHNHNDGILDVCHSDIQLDSILGNGSYNVVYSVKRIRTTSGTSRSHSHLQPRSIDPNTVVVKTLRSKLLNDVPMLAACAADLRKEGLVLAALQQQPNEEEGNEGARHVIRILAWAPTGLEAYSNGCHDAFFIVLEKLEGTLTDTLKEWKALEEFQQRRRRARQRHDRKQQQEQQQIESLTEDIECCYNPGRQSISIHNEHNVGYEYEYPHGKGHSKHKRRSRLLGSVKNSFVQKKRFISKALSQLQQKQLLKQYHRFEEGKEQGFEQREDRERGFDCHYEHIFPSGSNRAHVHRPDVDADEAYFWNARLGLLIDLCGAVSFLHSQKIIHRDLKPDNVGFDRNGTLKIFDFDVARILPPQAEDPDRLFKLTKKVGSPRYMSPEVARGQPYNEKTDVYGLGLLAYEVLSLKRPFESVPSGRSKNQKSRNPNNHHNNSTGVYEDCVPVVVREEQHRDSQRIPSKRSERRKGRVERLFYWVRNKDDRANTDGIIQHQKANGNIPKEPINTDDHNNSQHPRRLPKYANLRPLLPVATPQELLHEEEEEEQQVNSRLMFQSRVDSMLPSTSKNPSLWTRKFHKHGQVFGKIFGSSHHGSGSSSLNAGNGTKSSSKQQQQQQRQQQHNINVVDFETRSFFWTQSLRTIIDRSWSYDIPTRPSASGLKLSLQAEVDRINNAINVLGNTNHKSLQSAKSCNSGDDYSSSSIFLDGVSIT